MSLIRKGSAQWLGTGLEGSGTLSTTSGLLEDTPYSLSNRFENADGRAGTNPEELIAAAHAACFCMALSFRIAAAGYTPTRLSAEAQIRMQQSGHDWSFERIILKLEGDVPGIGENEFIELAEAAKTTCPVSMALSAVPIELQAHLS